MKQEDYSQHEYQQSLEADAVCGQCGNVNPEGTLICKTCGNNLRDQRMLRMAADEMLEAEQEDGGSSTFLVRALSILGILVVLWLGLNVGRISQLLTTPEGVVDDMEFMHAEPELFWTGPDSTVYDDMHAALTHQYPTESEADTARMNALPARQVAEGNYVLFRRFGTRFRYTGAAVIWRDGNDWRFSAELLNGVEIRGEASQTAQVLATQWEDAGALYDGDFFAVTGTATPLADGSVVLDGQSSYSRRQYEAVAFHHSDL